MAAGKQTRLVCFCASALVSFLTAGGVAWGSLAEVGVTPSGVEANVGPVEVKATVPSLPPATEPVAPAPAPAPVESATNTPPPTTTSAEKATAPVSQTTTPIATQTKSAARTGGSQPVPGTTTSGPSGSGPAAPQQSGRAPGRGTPALASSRQARAAASAAAAASARLAQAGALAAKGSPAAIDGNRRRVRAPQGAASSRRQDPPLLSSRSTDSESVLGVRIPPEAQHDALLATLILLGGALLLGLFIADDAGIGPRHREWRAYWSYRLTRR